MLEIDADIANGLQQLLDFEGDVLVAIFAFKIDEFLHSK